MNNLFWVQVLFGKNFSTSCLRLRRIATIKYFQFYWNITFRPTYQLYFIYLFGSLHVNAENEECVHLTNDYSQASRTWWCNRNKYSCVWNVIMDVMIVFNQYLKMNYVCWSDYIMQDYHQFDETEFNIMYVLLEKLPRNSFLCVWN